MADTADTDNAVLMSLGSDEVHHLLCIPCYNDSNILPACGYCIQCQEHLCKNCYLHHINATVFRYHTLHDENSMPVRQQLTQLTDTSDVPDLPVRQQLTQLTDISDVPDLPVRQQLTQLTDISDVPDLPVRQQLTQLTDISDVPDITVRQQLTQLTDTSDVPDIPDTMMDNTDYIDTVDTVDCMENITETPTTTQTHGSPTYKEMLSDMASSQHGEANESITKPYTEEYKNQQEMDEVATISESESRVTYENLTPTYDSEISVSTSCDDQRCGISSMTMVPPDRLILVDHSNISIKMIDVNSNSVITQLSFGDQNEDKPLDITTTTATQVAVTVPGRKLIQIINLTNNQLTTVHKVQTAGCCYGICYYDDKLLVTFCRPGKLEILNMSGAVITQVKTDLYGKDIFNQPMRVKANSDCIYVSDNKYTEIITLNWRGEVVSRFGDMEHRAGLPATVLGDNSLLVCWSNRVGVCQVTRAGTSSRIVIKHVRSPTAVCVDDTRHRLYISQCSYDNQIDNNIQVYKI